MSTSIFIDHSFLRKASQGHYPEAMRMLQQRIDVGSVRFISSLIHLAEIAKYPDYQKNLLEAQLIDVLRPLWLRTRTDLIREELLNAFHNWRGQAHLTEQISPFLVSPSQYAATGRKILVIEDGQDSAQGIVRNFHERPSLLATILKGERFADYTTTLGKLTRAKKTDPVTFRAIYQRSIQSMIRELAPQRDRADEFTRAEERKWFAEEVDPLCCPSLATELTLLDLRLQRGFTPEDSELWDLQYAESALPYVDVTVFDKQFSDLVRQASKRCRAIRASSFSQLEDSMAFLSGSAEVVQPRPTSC